MSSLAPSARARSSFSREPAVAITRAPSRTAIWMAAWPTPLPAASTSTSSSRWTCARPTSMCQAVRNVNGNAAASMNEIASGIGTMFCAGTETSSA